MKISSTLNLHFRSTDEPSEFIREGLRFMRAAGFDAADFSMKMIQNAGDGWKRHIEAALEAENEFGIKFEVCHLPFIDAKVAKYPALISEFDIIMHRSIDAAALLGVDYAVLHPNTTNLPLDSFKREEQYDYVMRHLEPFVEHATRVGVRLAVENMRLTPTSVPAHRYCQHPDELCDIADACGIDVCWDFGHANTCGLKQSESLAYIGKRLKVLHVNDNGGIEDDHIPPFSGTVDWRDAMKGLKLAGFSGNFNYEIKTRNIPESLRTSFAAYLLDSARELISYI